MLRCAYRSKQITVVFVSICKGVGAVGDGVEAALFGVGISGGGNRGRLRSQAVAAGAAFEAVGFVAVFVLAGENESVIEGGVKILGGELEGGGIVIKTAVAGCVGDGGLLAEAVVRKAEVGGAVAVGHVGEFAGLGIVGVGGYDAACPGAGGELAGGGVSVIRAFGVGLCGDLVTPSYNLKIPITLSKLTPPKYLLSHTFQKSSPITKIELPSNDMLSYCHVRSLSGGRKFLKFGMTSE